MRSLALLPLALACACATPHPTPPSPPAPPAPLAADAKAVAPLLQTQAARDFAAGAAELPPAPRRTLYRDPATRAWLTEAEAAALGTEARARLEAKPVDDELYYFTKYGSPLAYARPLDLLAARELLPAPGARVLDFGYGGIGQLRLLARLGYQATGVDVDPFLRALYVAPGDGGPFGRGAVRLLDGRFPADPAVREAVGQGYGLIVSKNVLKKGYIHPDRPADEKLLIHLGVDDAAFLAAVAGALAPGGAFLVYNICPAPSPPDKPFVPWSDGRSPFTRAQYQAAGLEVLTLDQDDTAAIRQLGHALGWDVGEGAMDLEHDLSVLFTLVRKPTNSQDGGRGSSAR